MCRRDFVFDLLSVRSGYEGFKPIVGGVQVNSVVESIGMYPDYTIYSVNEKRGKTWSDVTLQSVKSSSEEIFNSNVELNNPLLCSVFNEKKSKVFNFKDTKLEHWNQLINIKKWRGSESAFVFPINNNNNLIV